MAESVADLLGRLHFVTGPVESLYLNETRVHENFIGQLGAIESFTRTATKEGNIETPVVKLSAGAASQAGVTWTLADPVAQALVLRASLASQGMVQRLDQAGPGQYADFSGAGHISRPGMLDEEHRMRLAGHPDLYEALEAERSTQEKILQMMEGPDAAMWLLTIDNGEAVGCAVLDNRWLKPSFMSWVHADCRWDAFAMFRRRQAGTVLLAALHVTVAWP